MKMKYIISIALLFVFPSSYSQNNEIGKRLALESLALISYIGVANIGANDQDCKGVSFPSENIENTINTVVKPTLQKLSKFDKNSKKNDLEIVYSELKNLPQKKNGESLILQTIYSQKKKESFDAYGKEKGCVALSTMIATVIHQKKLSLKEIDELIDRSK
jgi:hypothetical protein